MAAVTTPQSTPDQVKFVLTIANECGCPDPGSDSGSGASCGGEVAAASGGGDSGAAACSGGGDRTGGIGNFAQNSAFGASGASATTSPWILPTRLECSSVFLM